MLQGDWFNTYKSELKYITYAAGLGCMVGRFTSSAPGLNVSPRTSVRLLLTRPSMPHTLMVR